MLKIQYIPILVISTLAMSACTTTNRGTSHYLAGPAKNNAYSSSAAEGATVVFYREAGNELTVPTIFVDDHVVGSLLPKRYAYTSVCSGDVKLRIDSRSSFVITGQTKNIKAEKQSVIYIRVAERVDHAFAMHVTDEKDVPKDLGIVENMSHIINRHTLDCKAPAVIVPPPAPVIPPAPKVLRQITLGADALFVFDRTEILPKGRAEIDKLISDIHQYDVKLTSLSIVGHTDRLGSDAYNDKLSLARSKAVAEYMHAHGLNLDIETSGRGKREPVTTDCIGNRANPKLISCLQPDRRVTIQLMGLAE